MANPKLDFLVLDTHNAFTMAVADLSYYPRGFVAQAPTLQVVAPGFPTQGIIFQPNAMLVLNSENLGITASGQELARLPDGIYHLKYTVFPGHEHFVEHSIMRVEDLLERFSEAFMRSDFSCSDRHLQRQEREQLDTIWFLLQEAIAAAQQCATTLALNLYQQADKLLDRYLNPKTCC